MTVRPADTPAANSAANSPGRAATLIPFLLVSVVWGSTWLAIKDQIDAVPPGWSITWRFLLSGAAMVVLAWMRGDSLRLPPGGQKLAMLVGLTQFCVNYQFVYQSERHLTSGVVAVLYALLMVPNALLSAVWLRSRIAPRFIAGSLVAIGGIALLLLHELRLAPAGSGTALGIVLAIGGICAASVSNVAQAVPAARAAGPVPFMAWTMIWGTLLDAGVALAVDGPPVFDPSLRYAGGIVYLALLGTVLPFPLYFRLIRDMGAGKAAYTGVVTPIVAMLLSTLFEGYRWSLLAVSGSLIALLGLVIALGAGAVPPSAASTARNPSA